MEFNKYAKHGAYHWRHYVNGSRYRTHADKVRRWVRERNVLDVGAGDGLITYVLRATGIENDPVALRITKAIGVNVIEGDAYSLPFPNDSFEAVTMIHVLEHFERPLDAITEAFRVAPVLYIATPERGERMDPFHYQEWKADELVDLFTSAGYLLDGEVEVVPKLQSMYARFNRNISN